MLSLSSDWLGSHALEAIGQTQTTAHRVYSESWRWIERYGEDYLIAQTEAIAHDLLVEDLRSWANTHQLEVRRVFVQTIDPRLREAPRLVFGSEELPPTSVATELDLRYQIDWRGLTSRGLFIDQRENRAFLAGLAPKRLLNLFAYTCAFSLVAARAGASTTSIDLSKTSLERGRENFRLNDLSLNEHFFHASDVRESLRFLAKKNLKFDAIIFDPPTFSRTKSGAAFQVERDFFIVLEAALLCAEKGAHVLLSTNCRSFSEADLQAGAHALLRRMGMKCEFLQAAEPLDIPADHRPTTLWVGLR